MKILYVGIFLLTQHFKSKGIDGMEKTVSVIIAVYNMEKYLEYCINSVLNQTFKDYEIILVNDGSVDSSEKIIDKYVKCYPDNIIKINKKNGGLSSARNAAFDAVNGKYITFLDADDYYDKNYLRILVDKAEKDNLDMVCSGQYKITEDGKKLKTIRYRIKNENCLNRRLNISGKLYRTEYIKKWGITFPDGKTYEDNSFNLQAFFLSNRIGFVEYEGYYQVVHEGSITSKPIDASVLPFAEWEKVARKVKNEIKDRSSDYELFEFTFISFMTYFLLVRNRKREYLSNDNKSMSIKSINVITEEFQKIVNDSFQNYEKNRYKSIFNNVEIPVIQKIGTYVFYFFCKRNKLNKLVNMMFRFR